MKKRLLSALLAAGLLASMLPVSAFAQTPAAAPEPTAVAEPAAPTAAPTAEPTEAPTAAPTAEPTEAPTAAPTAEPTEAPIAAPTAEPTEAPTAAPTAEPTEAPTATPTAEPTEAPGELKTVFLGTYISDEDDLPDNDELFAGYVESVLYDTGDVATYGVYGEGLAGSTDTTDRIAYRIYSTLKPEIEKVAAGTRDTTVLNVSIADLNIKYETNADKLDAGFKKAIRLLLTDCPYDLYWYDKTSTGGAKSQISYYPDDKCTSLEISLSVCGAYRAGTEAYKADTAKTGAAASTVAAAQAVVTANAGKNDYEKLLAYRDYICEQVSYNFSAAASSGTPYGDPWQLIYVFDNNPDTKVVCEGYAKAFQYLCDLTSMPSFTCYSVSGNTSEGHMWNIVTLGGKSYLVDVTNSDTGTIGAGGGLFLVGTSGSVDAGYTFALGSGITYQYDAATKSLFTPSILTLDSSNYTPSAPDAVASLAETNKGENGWYTGTVTVNAPSGYTISTSEVSGFGASFTTTHNGDVTYYVKSSINTVYGPKTIAVKYDAAAPTKPTLAITTAATDTTVTLTSAATDDTSGIQSYTLTEAANKIAAQTNTSGVFALTGLTPGTAYSFTVTAKDNAGNVSVASDACAVTTQKSAQAALSITGLPATVTYGDSFTLGTSGGSGDGAVTWEASGAATITSTGVVTVTGVGTVKISVLKKGGSAYSDTTAVTTFTVTPKALTTTVSGTATKTYDGTTAAPAGLGLALAGVINSDTVTAAAASYTYNSANVADTGKITATGITLAGADKAKYTVNATAEKAASITPKALAVTAASKTKTYGDADPALTYTATGLVGSDTLSGALARTAGENVGSYPINKGTLANPNYTISYTGASLTVTAKALADAMVTAAAQTYDGTAKTPVVVKDGATTLTAADYDVAYTNNKDAGTASYTVTGKGNYTGTVTGSFTIAKRPITVTADAKTKAYGDTDPALTYTVAAETPLAGTDTLTGALTRAAGNTVGSYAISQGSLTNANYAITFNGASLTITPRTATLVWANTALTYTGSAQAPTATVSNLVGSDVCTVTVTGGQTNAGSYTATATALSNANYALPAEATTGYTIGKKTIVPTVSQPADVDYTGSKIEPAVTVKLGAADLPASDYTVSYGTNTDAGAATVTVAPTDGSNYTFTAVTKTFTIKKVAYTGAKTASATYTYTATGTKTFDLTTLSLPAGYVLGTPTVGGTGIGSATIDGTTLRNTLNGTATIGGTATVTVPVTGSTNYMPFNIVLTVNFTDKTVTTISGVAGATGLVYTAAPQTGYTGTPTFTEGYTGTLTTTYYSGTTATGSPLSGAPTAVGSYTVVLAVPDTDTQYTGNLTLHFTVGKAPLTVTANAKTIAYGDTPAHAGVSYTGFVGGESESVLTGTLTYTYSYAQYGNVGSYTITPAGLSADSYTITFENGALTVSKRPLAVTIADKTSVYGAATVALTSAVTSGTVVNSDTAYTLTTTATATAAVGEYPITGTANGNYDVTFTGGKYTITPATLTGVSAAQSGTLTYNGSPQSAAVTTAATAVNSQPVAFTYCTTATGSYTAAVPAFTNAGSYTVYYKATAANHTTATGSFTVTIGVKNLAESMVTAIGAAYTGTAQTPATLKDGERVLTAADYDIAYTDNKDAGEASYTVTGKGNYTGTVTGKFTIAPRALTWDTSDLAAKKLYDGNTSAKVTGTLKVTGTVNGEDAKFTYSSMSFVYTDAEPGDAKTLTGTVTGAALDNANYALPTGAPTFTGKIVALLTLPPEIKPDGKLTLAIENGIPEVPVELKANQTLNTPEKIENFMKQQVTKVLVDAPAENVKVMDIELWYSANRDGNWVKATKDQFPAQGITVVVPYTELGLVYAEAQRMDFTVAHMITSGKDAGTPETPDCAVTPAGLQFVLHSLSPVAIAYQLKTSGGGSGQPAVTPTPAPVADTTPDKFTVNAWVNVLAGGTVSPMGVTTHNQGEKLTYTITPAPGYHITKVTVDGVDVGAVTSYTFAALNRNHEIGAYFDKGELKTAQLTPVTIPATSDEAPLTLWYVLAALAVGALIVLLVVRRKKHK